MGGICGFKDNDVVVGFVECDFPLLSIIGGCGGDDGGDGW